jgi:hypothetical protein
MCRLNPANQQFKLTACPYLCLHPLPVLPPRCPHAALPPLCLPYPLPCPALWEQKVKELLDGFKQQWEPLMENLEIAEQSRWVGGWVGGWAAGCVRGWAGGRLAKWVAGWMASAVLPCVPASACQPERCVAELLRSHLHGGASLAAALLLQAFDDINGLLEGPEGFDSSSSVWHQTGVLALPLAAVPCRLLVPWQCLHALRCAALACTRASAPAVRVAGFPSGLPLSPSPLPPAINACCRQAGVRWHPCARSWRT